MSDEPKWAPAEEWGVLVQPHDEDGRYWHALGPSHRTKGGATADAVLMISAPRLYAVLKGLADVASRSGLFAHQEGQKWLAEADATLAEARGTTDTSTKERDSDSR